jgi:hypothetical protein
MEYFKWEDASKDLQSKILDCMRDSFVDQDWWLDIYAAFKEKMDLKGFVVEDIRFSGFCCQGDGASYRGRMYDFRKFLKSYKLGNKYKKLAYCWEDPGFTVEVIYKGYLRYSHSNTMEVQIRCDSCLEEIDNLRWDELDTDLTKIFRGEADSLYADLDQEYDHLTSDELIEEYILDYSDEFVFDESGKSVDTRLYKPPAEWGEKGYMLIT